MLKALAVYLVVAAGVWLTVDPVRRVFVLPALFTKATRVMLLAFLPVALAVAWRYPQLGKSEADDARPEQPDP